MYLLQNIYSVFTVVCPLLRQKTKTPFLHCTLVMFVEKCFTFFLCWQDGVSHSLPYTSALSLVPSTMGSEHTLQLPTDAVV